MAKQLGYNFLFKSNEKIFAGVQTDDMSISPRVLESQTKEDLGETNSIITGHEITFSVSGLVEKKGPDEATKLDNDEIMALALSTGENANVPFVYNRSELKAYQGVAQITGYTEKSDQSNIASYTLNLKVIGKMTEVVPGA